MTYSVIEQPMLQYDDDMGHSTTCLSRRRFTRPRAPRAYRHLPLYTRQSRQPSVRSHVIWHFLRHRRVVFETLTIV